MTDPDSAELSLQLPAQDADAPASEAANDVEGDEYSHRQSLQAGMWRQLWSYARRYPRELAWIAFFAIVSAAMDISYPLITREVIDEVATNGSNARLLPYAILYFFATLIISVSVCGFVQMGGRLQSYISHDIRREGFHNLQALSFSYFDRRPIGWLMARMTGDCDRLSDILVWGYLEAVWGFTLIIGLIVAMFWLNPTLALIVLAVVPALAIASVYFQRHMLDSAREVRALNSRITASYNEGIMGVLTSKAFVREAQNQQEFNKLTGRMARASVKNLNYTAIYVPVVITLSSLAIGLTLAVGGFELLDGAITAGTLVAFIAITRQMFEPIEELSGRFAEMQMAQASAERVLSLINENTEIKDSPAVVSESLQDQGPITSVALDSVSFHYGPDEPVIRDITLSANQGETVAIIGPTGGGKSTLVNVICRFYEPVSGSVLINGQDYRQRSLDWLHSRLGMILQDSHVFSGTIRSNIQYGRLDATDEEVEAAAKISGAHAFITAFKQGYDTQTGESGTRLSTGQRQLVSFARAILADPQILVMDEATSSVDTETERQIQQGLDKLLEGRIAFVIAHRLSTIRNADKILVVDEGKIVEQGSHQELMAINGRYRSLYELQRLQDLTQGHGAG